MDSEYIKQLLDKYWNCQTTVEEERQLQEYFSGSQVPDSLRDTAALFLYFRNERQRTLSDGDFDNRVVRTISRPKGHMTSFIRNTMRIAAGIVVLVLAVWLVRVELRKGTDNELAADTYSDPNKAFEETKKALMMISRSFNTAEEQAKKINLFNEAQEGIRSDEKAEL